MTTGTLARSTNLCSCMWHSRLCGMNHKKIWAPLESGMSLPEQLVVHSQL